MCWVVIVRLLRVRAARARRRGGAPGRSSPRPSPACSRPGRGRRRPGRLCGRGRGAGRAEQLLAGLRADERRPRRRSPRTASRRPPVRPIPASAIVAVVAEARRPPRRRPWRSRRPCARASRRRRRRRAAGAGCGSRSGPRSARSRSWNVSRKKSRAAIDALAGRAAADDRGAGREEDRRPVRGRVGVGDEPPIVPQLRTCGSPMPPAASWRSG